jgi:hypothetical protein
VPRDPRNALRGIWGDTYENGWAPRFDPVFRAAGEVLINVILWGPGVASGHYRKRDEIGQALAGPKTNVATPEALIAAEPAFAQLDDTLLAVRIQAEQADIVIALAVDDREVTGVHVELTKMGDHETIGPKIHLFAPKRPAAAIRPLILEAASKVPEPRRFDYMAAQYTDCNQIRAKAIRWVEEVRRQKFLRLLREGSLPR